ncbi:hypothetical protein Tco_0366314 [Tanacetum coccineum]
MQDMMPGVLSIVLTLLGPMVINSSSLPIECRMTMNSSVLHSSSGLSILRQAEIVILNTLAMRSVTSPLSMLLKALSCNIFKNSSQISSLEFVIIGELIHHLDSKTQYAVLIRRFDTSYPTGRYGVSAYQYAGQHPKCAKCNFHHSGNCPVRCRCNQVGHFIRYCTGEISNERPRPTCYEYGEPNHFRRNCLRMNQAITSGGNRPNPMLAIKGNHNQGNNRNQARGKAFTIGDAEAPQDPNIVTGTFSLNNHYAIVLLILVLIIALSLPTS